MTIKNNNNDNNNINYQNNIPSTFHIVISHLFAFIIFTYLSNIAWNLISTKWGFPQLNYLEFVVTLIFLKYIIVFLSTANSLNNREEPYDYSGDATTN